nr:AAA family ATPase [Kribbella shirazensis]
MTPGASVEQSAEQSAEPSAAAQASNESTGTPTAERPAVPPNSPEDRPRPAVGVVYEPDESPDGFPLEYGNIIIGLPKTSENADPTSTGNAPETSAPETSAPETSAPETSAPETSGAETSGADAPADKPAPVTSAPGTSREATPGTSAEAASGTPGATAAGTADDTGDAAADDAVPGATEDAAPDKADETAAGTADELAAGTADELAAGTADELAAGTDDEFAAGADEAGAEDAASGAGEDAVHGTGGGSVPDEADDVAGGMAGGSVSGTAGDAGAGAAEDAADTVDTAAPGTDESGPGTAGEAASGTADEAASGTTQEAASGADGGTGARVVGDAASGTADDAAVGAAGEAGVGTSGGVAADVVDADAATAGVDSVDGGADEAEDDAAGHSADALDGAAGAAGAAGADGDSSAEGGSGAAGADGDSVGGAVGAPAVADDASGAGVGGPGEAPADRGGSGAGDAVDASGDGSADGVEGSGGADELSEGSASDGEAEGPTGEAEGLTGGAGGAGEGAAGDGAVEGAAGGGSETAGADADGAADAAVDGSAGTAGDDTADGGEGPSGSEGSAGGAEGESEGSVDDAGASAGGAGGTADGGDEGELTAEELAEKLAAEQAAMALITALMKLRGVLAGSQLPLEVVGADEARQQQKAMLDQLDDYLLPRLVQLEAPVLAVVGGSTGAGKSTLVNTVIGKVVSEPGVLRPTTRSPVLIHHPADADWFVGDRVLPGMARTTADEPGGMEDAGQLRLVAADSVPRGLAILDAPDIDSVVEANRDLATQLLAAADLWLFVTTAARYSDAVPWEFLQSASDRSTAVAVVLDRAPSETIDDITGHLAQMLLERGLGDSPLFSIQETVVDSNGMLPEQAVASIKDWLVDLAADAEARAAVVRRTLQGAVSAMVKKTPPFAAAVKAQAETAVELRSSVETAYDQGVKDIAKACQDGTLLRGEVLARWQEFVGTGELLKGLQSNAGRLRDRLKSSLGNKPAETRDVSDAIQSGLESLLREHATAAAERAEKAWQATAPGRQLLATAESGTSESGNGADGNSGGGNGAGGNGAGLGAVSEQFPANASRVVREWQAFVLDLVRKEGADKKSTARILEYGVNGLGLSLMVVVFASAAGIPKGAEASAGAGSAVVGQRLLEAVFGDKAVQGMVDKAREDLDGKVHALMDAEFARYLAVLDQHPVDAETARQLTEAARAVEDCT